MTKPFVPAWSLDGRLGYVQDSSRAVVYDGATWWTVQLPFIDVRSLAWSSDGSRFVVAAWAAATATHDVYTLRIDGSGVKRLTNDVDATAVSWR